MRVEKVPDSTYDMIGGLDKQIKGEFDACWYPFLFHNALFKKFVR
jgi:ATP-dependent 26S proteasome regulatory subunit